jgi:hypothetical protein
LLVRPQCPRLVEQFHEQEGALDAGAVAQLAAQFQRPARGLQRYRLYFDVGLETALRLRLCILFGLLLRLARTPPAATRCARRRVELLRAHVTHRTVIKRVGERGHRSAQAAFE